MKNVLKITVAGGSATGKSTVAFLIKELLKEKGFDVSFDGGIDFENEEDFDNTISKNIDKKTLAVSGKTIVQLDEVQLTRRGAEMAV